MLLAAADISFDGFPFTPYAIQQQLMEALYALLKKGGVGLFESPTGTPIPLHNPYSSEP